ncbi:MAG: hypothetical protein M1325_00955 [Actinobacteria bacterium]|nr:hypothetical protein [Actinomycetota bacterium]
MRKRLLDHRWTVTVAALTLVLAMSAAAWAVTGNEPAADPGTGAAFLGPFGGGAGFGPSGLGGGMGFHRGGGPLTDEQRAQLQQWRQQRQAAMEQRRDAFLNLIREKMSAEDQKTLDALVAKAKEQRDALEQARTALQDTTAKIGELVNKYFPGTDAAGSSTTTSTVPAGTAQ